MPRKIEENNLKAQLKKYNPIFPDDYSSESFSLPNMIVIVDDAVRKGINVCEGSIGWKSNPESLEILHLYDEAVEMSGLTFIPAPVCDSVYYVDPHNKKCYININNLYERTQKQKLAELTDLAFYLGAKSYCIDVIEEEKEEKKKVAAGVIGVKVAPIKADAAVEASDDSKEKIKQTYHATAEFAEKRTPVIPELCWFKHDESILSLIKQVCSGSNSMKHCDFIFECSKFASIQDNIAAKIDATVKK